MASSRAEDNGCIA